MSTDQFIYLNMLAILFFIILFSFRKKQAQPTRLNFNKKPSLDINELQVFFEFQGKEYEAFDVLNLPPGSSLSEIKNSAELLIIIQLVCRKDYLSFSLGTVILYLLLSIPLFTTLNFPFPKSTFVRSKSFTQV